MTSAPATGRWTEVADGVFVLRCAEFPVNVGLVVDGDEALLVDTGPTGAAGRAIRRVTRSRVVGVVTTHLHFDHCFGHEAFPGVPIWGHPRAVAVDDGAVETQREAAASWRPDLAGDLRATTVVAPTHAVDGDRELRVGDRAVVVVHPGHGHTDHDLVVGVPDAAVVLAGDVVEEGGPPSFGDSWPVEWPAAVDRTMALGPATVVGGHGRALDAHEVALRREELEAVVGLYRATARGEIGREEAYAASPFPRAVTLAAFYRISRTRRESEDRRCADDR